MLLWSGIFLSSVTEKNVGIDPGESPLVVEGTRQAVEASWARVATVVVVRSR